MTLASRRAAAVKLLLDNDGPGIAAAKEMRGRYREAGYEVEIRVPKYGKDWNAQLPQRATALLWTSGQRVQKLMRSMGASKTATSSISGIRVPKYGKDWNAQLMYKLTGVLEEVKKPQKNKNPTQKEESNPMAR